MKKLLIFLFIILFSINLSYSYKGYNDTYSNMTLESNGWCSGSEIIFTVYNKTNFDNHKSSGNDLCILNQTPSRDRCDILQTISPKVKIYDGPFDSTPILFDSTTNSSGQFKSSFSSPGKPYLIELTGVANYNDYYEPLFEVSKCMFSSDVGLNLTKLNTPVLFNQTFTYADIVVGINNSIINSSKNISVNVFNNFSQIKSPSLDGMIKIFEVNSNVSSFSSLKITVPINFVNKSNLKLYKFDSNLNSWNLVSDYTLVDKNLIISNSGFGIYSIVEQAPIVVEKVVLNSSTVVENVSETVVIENTSMSKTVPIVSKNSSSSNLIWYILIGVILALGIFYFIHKNNSKKNYHDDSKSDLVSGDDSEVLSSYNQIYNHSKDYVQKYKSEFSKDQIYRSLKDANISSDIIDKIFKEEF